MTKTIKERIKTIEKALIIMQKWITQQQNIENLNTLLFNEFQKRITKLEEEKE